MIFALATSTVLAAGANQRNDQEAEKMVEAMRGILSRSAEGLTVVKNQDGSETVDLDGRFQSAFVVRINPDSTLSEMCATSAGEIAAFMVESANATPDTTAGKNKTRKAHR